MGRPNAYTEAFARTICDRIANGGTLISICREYGIYDRIVRRWLYDEQNKVGEETFREAYETARKDQADYFFDLIINEASDLDRLIEEGEGADRKDKRWLSAITQAKRLKIESIKYAASKLCPQRYGEKMQLGGDPDMPIAVTIVDFSKSIVNETGPKAGEEGNQ
jgi:hypothetical protein